MQAVSPRSRKAAASPTLAASGGNLAPTVIALERETIAEARRAYIDALPIAAAIVSRGEEGGIVIDIANDLFRTTAGQDGPGRAAFFGATGIGEALAEFLRAGDGARQFGAVDPRTPGGRHFNVRFARLKPLPFASLRCLVSLVDRTQAVETERHLRDQMLRDTLTSLPNRLAFTERIEAVLRDPSFARESHAVIAVDLARFSRFNESAGAIAGDELLVTFARRLLSAMRPGDMVARIGGDEFGLLVRLGQGARDAFGFAKRVKEVLGTPFRLSELEICVDCAIGLALVGGSEESAEELLRNAQFALKRAKQAGRTQLYRPADVTAARRRFSIETELRRAIERQRLRLSLQPLINLETKRVAGFEALARWDDPPRGAVPPSEFIAVAEESGLILPLGRWALDTALAVMAEWDRKAARVLPVYASVNVSAVQVQRDDVPALVADGLARHGLAPDRLVLEVTESAIIHDPERASEVLGALHDMGIRVAMDDFGTGYTSLAYLQRLPIDMLKIDGSFITGMLDDPDKTAIVRAVLSLAASLKMSTTAEGVESEEVARALRALGCVKGQGFFFAEPLPPDAAYAYWAERSA